MHNKRKKEVNKMFICERCTKFGNVCECVPYDVDCDENFEAKEVIDNDRKE